MALPDIPLCLQLPALVAARLAVAGPHIFWHEAMMYGRIFTTQQKNQHFAILSKPPGLV